jgi:hypothetical protein
MNSPTLIVRSALFIAVIAACAIMYEGKHYAAAAPTTPPVRSGRELVLVFIGSTVCAPSRQPGFNKVVREVAEQLRIKAYAQGRRFELVGVALSGSTAEGVQFLSDFGPFDELIAGRGWLNSGATDFVWRDLPGTSAVPQLLVLNRNIDVSRRGIRISPDSLVIRVTGVERIRSWSAAGAPLD